MVKVEIRSLAAPRAPDHIFSADLCNLKRENDFYRILRDLMFQTASDEQPI